MAVTKKYLGIRFPFTAMDDEGLYVDLDYNPYKEIKSDIIHLLFTSKGQRIRMPNFGTNLISFIFEPNDEKTITDIKIEMQSVIKKFIPNVTITNVNITPSDIDNYSINVEITYDIDEGTIITSDIITTTI